MGSQRPFFCSEFVTSFAELDVLAHERRRGSNWIKIGLLGFYTLRPPRKGPQNKENISPKSNTDLKLVTDGMLFQIRWKNSRRGRGRGGVRWQKGCYMARTRRAGSRICLFFLTFYCCLGSYCYRLSLPSYQANWMDVWDNLALDQKTVTDIYKSQEKFKNVFCNSAVNCEKSSNGIQEASR